MVIMIRKSRLLGYKIMLSYIHRTIRSLLSAKLLALIILFCLFAFVGPILFIENVSSSGSLSTDYFVHANTFLLMYIVIRGIVKS